MTENNDGPTLVWFRDDLRLADNPALDAAIERGRPLAFLYILDEASDGIRPLGSASRWWLHHSLERLSEALASHGHALSLRRGKAAEIVPRMAEELGCGTIVWNRRYRRPERDVDSAIKAQLRADGRIASSFHANLLFEPWTIRTGADQPFRVFTPFWKSCRSRPEPRPPLPTPMHWPAAVELQGDRLDDWNLLPSRPDWAGGLREAWMPGESGAQDRLAEFLDERLGFYAAHRDEPSREATSRLSPHLRFGEISPFQLWHAAEAAHHRGASRRNVDKFLSELGWREFSWNILYHQPDLASANFQPRFDAFRWAEPDPAALHAWRTGNTGYPIIDAGMRQLWQTGWMHNRVRMIVASFLIKNLLIDWRVGEAWFWDTLVDADAANNPASWQWVAGSGADAAPYFRIFNPVLQAGKFDPKGRYIRAFVPEIAHLPDDAVHEPWRYPGKAAYPKPIVDLAASRQRALDAFAATRETD